MARRREPIRAFKARLPSWYWSSEVRVIAPAHRDEDCTVRAFLRSARRVSAAGTFPIRTRCARSAPASEPRCFPTVRSTDASVDETCSRVLIRHPEGGATTNGAASTR